MNEAETVRRCQRGDRDAFRRLVEAYGDLAYGTAYLMTHDATMAEDLVREAFLSAWKGIRGFRAERPFRRWFLRILVNKVVSHKRRRPVPVVSLEEATIPEEPGETPEELAKRAEEREQVRLALDRLSEEHRRVVALRYFAELSVPQVATVLGCRQGTVKSRLHRALKHLRDLLEEKSAGGYTQEA